MIDRIKRIAIAQETLKIIHQKSYTNSKGDTVSIEKDLNAAIANSEHLGEREIAALKSKADLIRQKTLRVSTSFEVTDETTLQAAARLVGQGHKIFCLNFASAKNPGGGFLNGSQAQEESLARSSALYPCISQMTALYAKNKALRTCLYSDDMIYSPDTPVFRTDNGELLDPYYKVSFLTVPAINAGIIWEREKQHIPLMDSTMLNRLENLLAMAVAKGYRTLLLGAWGCGVFRNDPVKVAAYFKYHLVDNEQFKGMFDKVVFAVYGGSTSNANLGPFQDQFSILA